LKKRLSALENPRVFRVVCQEMETKHVFHSVTEIWFAEAEMRTTSALMAPLLPVPDPVRLGLQ
jgi:hypothetical protein